MRKVVHYIQIYPFAKIGNFWTSGCSHFVFLKFDQLKSLDKNRIKEKKSTRPGPRSSAAHSVKLAHGRLDKRPVGPILQPRVCGRAHVPSRPVAPLLRHCSRTGTTAAAHLHAAYPYPQPSSAMGSQIIFAYTVRRPSRSVSIALLCPPLHRRDTVADEPKSSHRQAPP
jgi:hypothetical protein